MVYIVYIWYKALYIKALAVNCIRFTLVYRVYIGQKGSTKNHQCWQNVGK